jgi:ComF family protein
MLLIESSTKTSKNPGGLLWKVLDWMYPPFCCNCDQIGYEICPTCWDSIETLSTKSMCNHCGKPITKGNICADCEKEPPVYDQLKSWASYEGAVRSIVTGIKFGRRLGLIPYLVQPLAEVISNWNPKVDWLTAVPLGKQRQKERGYNQSDLVAREVARATHLPYTQKAVKRVRETHSQVGLNAADRQQNMQDAFQADPTICRGSSFLLFDDIATTGATLNTCAKALQIAGAENIYCFTMARTSLYPNSNPNLLEVRK